MKTTKKISVKITEKNTKKTCNIGSESIVCQFCENYDSEGINYYICHDCKLFSKKENKKPVKLNRTICYCTLDVMGVKLKKKGFTFRDFLLHLFGEEDDV